MNLGGYDNYSLHLAPRAIELPQGGYVGCVRGFKIADHVVDLSRKAQEENPGKKICLIISSILGILVLYSTVDHVLL